jgi:23S rRNA (cytosine1962-C5)-methyltransferase
MASRPTCSTNCGLNGSGRRFDLIILDPPKFAPSAAHAERAARAYRDINVFGFRLLNPGGSADELFVFGWHPQRAFPADPCRCSARMPDADARILRRLGASPDHPVALNFSEGEYLKGLLCQVE